MPPLAQQAPPADDIRDIVVLEPPQSVWPLVLTIALALLAVAAVALLAWWWMRRSRRTAAMPPEARARDQFRRLAAERETMEPNRFGLAVSEALKTYLADKFDDPVRYETTPEFLERVAREQPRLPDAAQQELRRFLTAADEVKFANAPDAAERTAPLLKMAENVVHLCQVVGQEARTGRRP